MPAEKETIQLRLATLSDQESLFRWRNHPDVRRYAINPDEIEWQRHCDWLTQTLLNGQRVLLIGEADGQPIGVLRYDFTDDRALVSIYLVPEKLGQGYGAPLLLTGSQWLATHHPAIRVIKAEIAPENTASIKVFEKAGYQNVPQQTEQGMLTYEYTF